jgi:hypothetical protein
MAATVDLKLILSPSREGRGIIGGSSMGEGQGGVIIT